jgi:hypothetical protein
VTERLVGRLAVGRPGHLASGSVLRSLLVLPCSRTRWVPIVAAFALLGCGGQLRSVPTVVPVVSEGTGTVVPYPPPPAPVEEVTADPGQPCRWRDGYWLWREGRWAWSAGDWLETPLDCRRVAPVMKWHGSPTASVLEFWPATWAPSKPGQPCSERRCLAADLAASPSGIPAAAAPTP